MTAPVPTVVEVTEPMIPYGGDGSLTVSLSQDLAVSWTGTSAGQVNVLLEHNRYPDPIVNLQCQFDPSSGTGVVPQGLLQQMRAQIPDTTPSGLWVTTTTAADTAPDATSTVHFDATTMAVVSGQPRNFSTPVAFQ